MAVNAAAISPPVQLSAVASVSPFDAAHREQGYRLRARHRLATSFDPLSQVAPSVTRAVGALSTQVHDLCAGGPTNPPGKPTFARPNLLVQITIFAPPRACSYIGVRTQWGVEPWKLKHERAGKHRAVGRPVDDADRADRCLGCADLSGRRLARLVRPAAARRSGASHRATASSVRIGR